MSVNCSNNILSSQENHLLDLIKNNTYSEIYNYIKSEGFSNFRSPEFINELVHLLYFRGGKIDTSTIQTETLIKLKNLELINPEGVITQKFRDSVSKADAIKDSVMQEFGLDEKTYDTLNNVMDYKIRGVVTEVLSELSALENGGPYSEAVYEEWNKSIHDPQISHGSITKYAEECKATIYLVSVIENKIFHQIPEKGVAYAIVAPGGISTPMQRPIDEDYVVIKGKIEVALEDTSNNKKTIQEISRGQRVHLPKGWVVQFRNASNEDAVFYVPTYPTYERADQKDFHQRLDKKTW